MQKYTPTENALVPYVFPEIAELFKNNVELPHWDTRHDILNNYRSECTNWLQNGNTTVIRGLERFKYVYVLYGGSQYIDDLVKFEDRHIELHKHEYVAYRTLLDLHNMKFTQHDSFDSMGKDSDKLVIVSYPFSLNGNSDVDIEKLLTESTGKITLDSVFLGTNMFPVTLDFNELTNVESFVFSFSKGFGLRYSRIGIMFTDKFIPEYDIYHKYAYLNLYSCQIARELMSKYSIDYFTEKYKSVQEEACKLLNVATADCLHLGIDTNTDNPDKKVRITHLFDKLC